MPHDQPAPDAEAERLAALRRHGILDTPSEAGFDAIVEAVRRVCRVPVALVSLVDADRQWFKARAGTDLIETPRDTAVCTFTIEEHGLFEITDLSRDPRTAGMALVTGPEHLRFYAGVPLVTREGHALGSLCAIDVEPRPQGLSDAERTMLEVLAAQTVALIEMRDAVAARDVAIARDARLIDAQRAEARFRGIVDSAIDSAIISFDEAGRVASWSDGAERMFGWTEAEMLGEPAERIFSPEDRAAGVPAREFGLARSTGRAPDVRWHLRRDGSRFYADGAVTLLDGSAQAGFVKVLRDITREHETRSALVASREKLELATRATRLGQFDYFPDENRLEWDDRCRELFGLPPGVPVDYQNAYVTGLHPDDRERATAAVADALDPAGSGTFDVEYRTIGIVDGIERCVVAKGTSFREGDSYRLIGTVQDVTADRQAQAALREAEQRLRLAVRATNDAIWDWDLIRDQVQWNATITSAYGHRREDLGPDGAWWIGHIHPEDRERIDASIHRVIDGDGSDWTDEYRFRRADGSYADIRDRGFVLRNDTGRAVRMIGAMLDQSERKRIEREMQSEIAAGAAELDRLWRSSPDLQLALDRDGIIREANAAWTTLLGYAPEELIGRSYRDFVHPDDLPASDGALDAAVQRPTDGIENRYLHKHGSIRWLSWVAAPDRGSVLATGRDITDRKAAEETLRRTEEALRQSQKVEAVGQLTGGVAHDFNNLLTVIRGSVDLLRRPDLPEHRRTRYIEAIADTADRATRLTSQLLAFARRSTLQPEVFDVNGSISALEPMLRTLAGSRIRIRYALPDAPAWVNTDRSQFDTAIVNMAVNARDAMEGEGELALSVRTVRELPAIRAHGAVSGAYVAVSITDTGSGIPADKIDHIFEPFFTTKGVGHGTGLGLSQVFGFAKQSDGEITVESEVGRGTTFTLYFPQSAPGALADEAAPPRRALRQDARVLVVEDNAEVGDFATRALAELGYRSHWAPDADAALAELQRDAGAYDIVFTDVVMPGRSGIELAELIRAAHPDLPVVLTSGYSHILAERGTSGFHLLHKPYSIDELARALDSVSRVGDNAAG